MGAGGGGAAQRDLGWNSIPEPRPSRGVCLRDCFGWGSAGLRLLAAGERISQSSAEVGAGLSARAAGGGRCDSRGCDSHQGGVEAPTKRCLRVRTRVGALPPGRPVRGATAGALGVTADPGFPFWWGLAWECRAPGPLLRRGMGSKIEGRIEVGLTRPTSELQRLTTPGAGARNFSRRAAWGRGGRGGVAWRLTPPSSRPAAGLRGGAVSKVSPSPAGAASECPSERRVSEAGAEETKFPGLVGGRCPGCALGRPTPREGNGFQTPARGHPRAARLGQRHRVPEDRPELWPPASLQRPLLTGEHQGQYG